MGQDKFLVTCRRRHLAVTLYLREGFRLRGSIVSFDDAAVLLECTNGPVLVLKYGILSIVADVDDTAH